MAEIELSKKFQKSAVYLFIAAATSTATATEAPTIGLLPNQVVKNFATLFIIFDSFIYAYLSKIPENKELFASF